LMTMMGVVIHFTRLKNCSPCSKKPVWVNMKFLLKWFAATVAKINCFVNGHGPFEVLHIYEAKAVARYFKGKRIEKLRADSPAELVYEHQKIRCAKCGRISLAWTLIGAMTHTNTEPDAWQ